MLLPMLELDKLEQRIVDQVHGMYCIIFYLIDELDNQARNFEEHLQKFEDDLSLEFTANLDENIRIAVSKLTQSIDELQNYMTQEHERLNSEVELRLDTNDVKIMQRIDEFTFHLTEEIKRRNRANADSVILYEKLSRDFEALQKEKKKITGDISHLESINDAIVNILNIMSALYKQDEQDKYSISLYGLKEDKIKQTTDKLIVKDKPVELKNECLNLEMKEFFGKPTQVVKIDRN